MATATVALAIALLLAGGSIWWIRRGLKRRRLVKVATADPQRKAESASDPMIVWSEAVREALVARFGPGWRAKTTEEIAESPALIEGLGAERTTRLVRFLAEADRAKFSLNLNSTSHSTDQTPTQWEAWVADFVAACAGSAAGARSRIKGK